MLINIGSSLENVLTNLSSDCIFLKDCIIMIKTSEVAILQPFKVQCQQLRILKLILCEIGILACGDIFGEKDIRNLSVDG